jgi:hypothetical protein
MFFILNAGHSHFYAVPVALLNAPFITAISNSRPVDRKYEAGEYRYYDNGEKLDIAFSYEPVYLPPQEEGGTPTPLPAALPSDPLPSSDDDIPF